MFEGSQLQIFGNGNLVHSCEFEIVVDGVKQIELVFGNEGIF